MCTVDVHYAPRTRSRLRIDFKLVAVVDYIYPNLDYIRPDFFILNYCIKFQLAWRGMVEVKERIRACAEARGTEVFG